MKIFASLTIVCLLAGSLHADAPEARPLSVPPLDHVVYPESRPDWIDAKPSGRRIVVQTGPCENADQADEKFQSLLPVATRSLAMSQVDILPPDFDPIQDDDLANYVTRRYTGEVLVGDLPMAEFAAEVTIDDDDVATFRRRGETLEVGSRIAAIGVCLAGGLVILMTTGGVLGVAARRRGTGV